MRLTHDGLTLSFDPISLVLGGAPIELFVQLEPTAENARVEVAYRRNGDRLLRRQGRRLVLHAEQGNTRFAVELPAFKPGDTVTCELVGWIGMRRVPEAGNTAASFRLEVRKPPNAMQDARWLARPLEELAPTAERRRARAWRPNLAGRGIETAADLLMAREDVFDDVRPARRKFVQRLVAHAELSLTVDDAQERSDLIDTGFEGASGIAAVPLAKFRRDVAGFMDGARAEALHRSASVQAAFLDSLATGGGSGSAQADIDRPCVCEDCEAFISPIAYLVDLLDYIRSTVLFRVQPPGGWAYDEPFGALDELLRQPLSEIQISCRAVTDPVRRVRLGIEALRRHLQATGVRDADLTCSPFPAPIDFVIAGDVDGDGRDELVVSFQYNYNSWLALPNGVLGGIWVMDFDPASRRWSHLGHECETPSPTGAAFLLGPGLVARFGFCADVDGDNRAEIVLAVGNQDGSADPQLGRTWFWVMDFDPASGCWRHLSEATFEQMRADLWIDDVTVDVINAFPANIDAGDRAAVTIAAASTLRPNAFWVFKLIDLTTGPGGQVLRSWLALSPGADASLPAFECDPPGAAPPGWRPRLAFARDVNRDGRDEIVVIKGEPGLSQIWVMAYTPSAVTAVGTWNVLNSGGTETYLLTGHGAYATHAFGGDTRGINSDLVLVSFERTPSSDPNRFYEFRFNPAVPDLWDPAVEIDCAVPPFEVTAAFCADADGDFSDELFAVAAAAGGRLDRTVWVMKRQPDGQWQHLSPIAGHARGADLEWGPGGYTGRGAIVASLDRTPLDASSGSLVVYGDTSNEIWILKWDVAAAAWRHLSPVLRPGLDAAYLLTAYRSLLAEIGTSFEELRAARGAAPAARAAIADRIAVPNRIELAAADTIDRLLIDPQALNEASLETLFGLVDTSRSPLSTVRLADDDRRQIRRIELDGVFWSRNPWATNVGLEGELTLIITRPPGGDVEVRLLTPAGSVVASGAGGPQDRFRLSEEASSGLSGWVEVDYSADATGIRLSVLPRVACWRLLRLREMWDEQDWPPTAFEPVRGGDLAVPAIDPDVVGPDDFLAPNQKVLVGDPDGPLDLWVRRREWVDVHLQRLRNLQPDFDAMLEELRPPSGGPDPNPEDHPWAGAAPASAFASLAAILTGRDAGTTEAARVQVRSELWLEPDAFLRLVALRAQLREVQLEDAEWEEVRSILVLAQKRFNYVAWRDEERAAQIVLGPDIFWPAGRPPSQGAWPPTEPTNGVWVDPETVALADFPQGTPSLAAQGLWYERRERLSLLAAEIRALRPDLEAMLVFALEAPPAATTWRERVGVLFRELSSTDRAVSEAARDAVTAEFRLESEPFRRLAAFDVILANMTANGGRAPTDTEWLDVELLLVTGLKRKREYPGWRAAEQALGVEATGLLPYWRTRRAALPRWRAADETRLEWEQELRWRARAPVVDPDRFPATWLRTRALGDPASSRYTERRGWLEQQAQALRNLGPSPATLLERFDTILLAGFFTANEPARLAGELWARRNVRGDTDGWVAAMREVFGPLVAAAQPAALRDLFSSVRNEVNSTDPGVALPARVRAASDFFLGWADLTRLADIVVAAAAGSLSTAASVEFDRLLARAMLVGRIVGLDAKAAQIGLRKQPLLDQLALTPAAHAELLRIRNIAAAEAPVLEVEWDVVLAIALRAMKQRRFGRWLLEEYGTDAATRVRVGPDSFALPDDTSGGDSAAPLWQLPEWKVSGEEARLWGATLAARAQQDRDVLAGLKDVVSRVEEATLPILRDALLEAAAPAGDGAADWVGTHLLFDAQESGCGVTTRAGHAIDTVLAFLWSLRNGQLRDAYPQLRLNAPSFDADWRWIGSYATWRSAVFVRQYPENLLQPTLRRHKTPVFATLLDELRSGREVSPTVARDMARRYADYFRDVCNLNINSGEMACARINGWKRDAAAIHPGLFDFLFARSDVSGAVYWSTIEVLPPDPLPLGVIRTGFEQSFWEPLTALQGTVVGLVGATTYQPRPLMPQAAGSTPGWVYLFALTRDLERTSLVFIRYNLQTHVWEDQQDLAPLPPSGTFSAHLVGNNPPDISMPPALGFEEPRTDGGPPNLYQATMNGKGVAWDTRGLRPSPAWLWQASSFAVTQTPRELLVLNRDSPGSAQLAVVPAGGGVIELVGLAGGGAVRRGATAQSVEPQSFVCAGDFDGDGQDEIAWTLDPTTTDPGRSTTVLIEKRTGTTWQAQGSVRCTTQPIRSTCLVPANLNNTTGTELLVGIQDQFVSTVAGTWGSFWTIERTGTGYGISQPYDAMPDRREAYARGTLGAAFAVCPSSASNVPGPASAAFALSGDFDGDQRDELVVFVAPVEGLDLSRGNDYWALDCRGANTLRALGDAQEDVPEHQLKTVVDLGSEDTFAAAAVTAKLLSSTRDALVILPFWGNNEDGSPSARGSRVWAAQFAPGGAGDPADGGKWQSLLPIDLSLETTPVALAVAADLDGDGQEELVLCGSGRTWVRKYDAVQGTWTQLPDLTSVLPPGATVAAAVAGKFLNGPAYQLVVATGDIVAERTVDPIGYNLAGHRAIRPRYRCTPNGTTLSFLELVRPNVPPTQTQCSHTGIKPKYSGSNSDLIIDERVNHDERRRGTRRAMEENIEAGMPAAVMTFLWEAFYDLPVAIALALQRSNRFVEALDWFRLAYDYNRSSAPTAGEQPETRPPNSAPVDLRKVFYGLVLNEDAKEVSTSGGDHTIDWVSDPLDAHAIAQHRGNAYTRGTLLLIVRCLLDYADAEFTAGTSESITRARLLYEEALQLLRLPVLKQSFATCSDLLDRATARIADPEVRPIARQLGQKLARVLSRRELGRALDEVVETAAAHGTTERRFEAARAVVAHRLRTVSPPYNLGAAAAESRKFVLPIRRDLLRTPAVAAATWRVGAATRALAERNSSLHVALRPLAGGSTLRQSGGEVIPVWGRSTPSDIQFCSSPNPVLQAHRLHAELNLYKIRTCRNIAGMRQTLDFYSGATDQRTGMPMIGTNGELVLPGRASAPPTPYRYGELIRRARDLTATAQHLEALMQAALERRDNEAYTLMQARQHARVVRETIRLNELQVRSAEDRVVRTQMQQERAQIEQDYFTQLLAAGENEYEQQALEYLRDAVTRITWSQSLRIAAGIGQLAAATAFSAAAADPLTAGMAAATALQAGAQAIGTASEAASLAGTIRSTESNLAKMQADFARRREDWQLRQRLATQDIQIAAQDTAIEQDGVRVAEQQRTISQIEADSAEQVIDFLGTKFTGVDLYDWMSRTLERAYAVVLRHATSTARLAAGQLTFERPDGIPPPIGEDYWSAPTDDGTITGSGTGTIDRRGLTGAERLLQDLTLLDQYAFETNRRKLQLTKTISLAQLAPLDLERLRTTGIMTFATSAELFDRDRPGYYLRLIKRVSVSLIALVPPTEGIHAELRSAGISRVVVGPEIFQPITVRREPSLVALSSPVGATGVFTFEAQPELANPFEFEGVDTTWEFRLPQAGNRFDFSAIADLLVTIDYTALESADYRRQVIRRQDQRFSADRAFSVRNDFSDAWWDLHNPDQSPTPMTISFHIGATDFPPNLDEIAIEHLAIALSSRSATPRGLTVRLRFTEEAEPGALPPPRTSWLSAAPIEGIASTRRGNAGSWLALAGRRPVGCWELSFSDSEELREWMRQDVFLDVLLVVSFRARTPPWPP